MYVCICNALTEEELQKIAKENPDVTINDLRNMGIAADHCYKCSFETEELLLKHIAEQAKATNEDN